jgi:DNA-binding CsgD family transcriptional regulator
VHFKAGLYMLTNRGKVLMHPPYQQYSQFRKLGVIDKLIEQEIKRSCSRSTDFQNWLIEFMKEGVVALSTQLNPIYLNSKAEETLKVLRENSDCAEKLLAVITDISHQFNQDIDRENRVLIAECQLVEDQLIRIRAYKLPDVWNGDSGETESDRPYLLIFLEDQTANLQEDLKIEQQKYNLTDREVEIWKLLLQAYSYQEIAKSLHISLNTVKFHVKNIYAKKRCSLKEEQVIYFDP